MSVGKPTKSSVCSKSVDIPVIIAWTFQVFIQSSVSLCFFRYMFVSLFVCVRACVRACVRVYNHHNHQQSLGTRMICHVSVVCPEVTDTGALRSWCRGCQWRISMEATTRVDWKYNGKSSEIEKKTI